MKMTSEYVENNNVHEVHMTDTASTETAAPTQEDDILSHITSRKLSLENDVTKGAESTQFKHMDSVETDSARALFCPIRISVTQADSCVESMPYADKTGHVLCRQIPGSPDMSPVTRRRRTALAKKAIELERDGKVTRLRALSANCIVLEFRDKIDGEEGDIGRRGSRDDSSLLWKRYKSPRGERSRTVPSIKFGESKIEHGSDLNLGPMCGGGSDLN